MDLLSKFRCDSKMFVPCQCCFPCSGNKKCTLKFHELIFGRGVFSGENENLGMNSLYLVQLIMGRVFLGLRQFTGFGGFAGLRIIEAIKIFDFISLITYLTTHFYRDSFYNDQNVSDKLSKDSGLKSPNCSWTQEWTFSTICQLHFMFLRIIF